MSLPEEGSFEESFYDETHQAIREGEKIMEASFADEIYHNGTIRISFEELYENFGSVEEPIEASFFEEVFEASPRKKNKSELERLLYEVSINFRPFEVIREIKKQLTKQLNQQLIHENEFRDFNLGIMSVLNALDKDDPIEKFLRQAYIGCFQCFLCLQSDGELQKVSRLLGHHLSNAMNVLRYVLSKQGVSIPDRRSEEMDYDKCKLKHLSQLTDHYLKNSKTKRDYEFLRRHEQLIKDYEIVSEIDFALGHLRDEFEELRMDPHEVSRSSNNLMLFSKLEELTDLSSCCC